MNKSELINAYREHGVLDLGVRFSTTQIEHWKNMLHSEYSQDSSGRDGGRRYVDAAKLNKLGILGEIFTEDMKFIITALEPNPVFFHSHAYSIPHSQKKNHIGFHQSAGWHRDHVESGFSENDTSAFSLFIYLTDVDEEGDGVFELIPKYIDGDQCYGKKSLRFFGKKGTAFIWDRRLFHRPHVNSNDVSREIIKISVHSNGYPNSRISHEEFCSLQEDSDPFVAYISGKYFQADQDYRRFDYMSAISTTDARVPNPNSRCLYMPDFKFLLNKVKTKLAI